MSKIPLVLCLFITFLLYSHIVSATTYLQAYATGIVQPGANVTVQGSLVNTSGSDTISGINISASISSNNGSQVTGATGTFNFNVTAPSTVGISAVTVTTNESAPKNKIIPVYVSNVTGGSVSYVSNVPPYSAGNMFTINVTFMNGTNRVTSYTPTITIYTADGPEVSGWTIANFTPSSDANGVMQYNITIPSSASSGQYVIVLEKGAITSMFSIQSGYLVVVNPETTNGEVLLNFAPGSTVMILTKVKTVAGVAVASAASSVTAYITLPNGTTRNITLQARNQTTYPGYYNNSFTETSASGTYNVRVDAVISSTNVQSYTMFSTKSFNVKLEPQTDFFKEWGGSSAFAAGQTVGLNIIAVNLSTDSMFFNSTSSTNRMSCDAIRWLDLFYANGTSINSTVTGATFTTGQYMMNTICRVQFTGPSVSNVYGIKLNVTIGGATETAYGYFSIQKYVLKPTVVAGFGGEMEMMTMVSPGENTTISLNAYNITNNAALGGANITNVVVNKIVPLEFSRGVAEITSSINYTVTYGSTPTIVLTVPNDVLGPASVEIEASIGGETVRGNVFFVANYLMGFMKPSSSGGGEGEMMSMSSCSGNVTFTGRIQEVKSGQAVTAGSVMINSIAEAREEFTDKNIIDYVTLLSTGTSDSTGTVSVNISFGSYSFSGFYFILLNATYMGKTAGIPAGFMCKNLNFWPNVYAVGGNDATWQIAPTSGVKIVIINITRMNDSKKIGNSTISFPRLFNFNPSKGGESILIPTSTFSGNISFINFSGSGQSAQNNITVYLHPDNFTLTDGTSLNGRWPTGFIDLQPTICTSSLGSTYPWSDGCDTGFGGFQVVPFDAWMESWPWGQPMSVNSTLSYVVSAKTNVSINCTSTTCDRNISDVYTGANNTGFTIKLGRPWEGELTTISDATVQLVSDDWNNTNHSALGGAERWRLNFTIPTTMRKGETQVMIIVNNSNGETNDIFLFTTLTKYTIKIPYEEGIENWWGGNVNEPQFLSSSRWNVTAVNQTLGIWSKSTNVCYHFGLNSTRYGDGGSRNIINYNYGRPMENISLILIDNTTAGTYDYLVINNTGNLSYATVNNRTISQNAFGVSGLYLRKIDTCYVKITNATAITAADIAIYGNLPSWGGDGQVNAVMTIPYVVLLGSTPISGAAVHANGIAQQNDQGFGFVSTLIGGYNESAIIASSQNYSYINATTDSLGFAFLRVNLSSSGRFNLFWKVNTSSADYDIATMASGTNIELRSFDTNANAIYWTNNSIVTMRWVNNSVGATNAPIWSAFNGTLSNYVYNGTVTETSANDFIRDSNISTWYVVYDPNSTTSPTSGLLRLDDDINLTSYQQGDPNSLNNDTNDYPLLSLWWNSTSDSLNRSFGAVSNMQLKVGAYQPNTTNATNTSNFVKLQIYQDNPSYSNIPNIHSANENITVKVCAQTFDLPTRKPIYNATVKLYTKSYSMGPPQTVWLTLFDPFDDSTAATGGSSEPSSTITTGPAGCVAFKATYPDGWPTGCREVQGKITSGTTTEQTWIGWACR